MALNKSALKARPAKQRRAQMAAFAQRFSSWRPATEVLTKVRALPTIFPGLDVATRIGGWPLQRFSLVHGPTNHGKTALVHGLGRSFLEQDHFYVFIDAEMTTPEDWIVELMGELARHPGFVARRPTTFEETADAVREFLTGLGEAKARGELAPETSALVVVDSIRKLVPKDLLAKLSKDAASAGKGGSIDGMGGRAAQIKAALNAAWLDELIPLLHHSGATMVAIARESVEQNGYLSEIKVGGGRALSYDSSLIVRVKREWVKHGEEIVGERHVCEVRKTKVAGKDDKADVGSFCTSNGKAAPRGFWRARDVLELALELGVLKKTARGIFDAEDGQHGRSEVDTLAMWQGGQLEVLAGIERECRKLAAVRA